MTQVCSPKVIHNLPRKRGMMQRVPILDGEGFARLQIAAATCMMMKTFTLPGGKTAAGDDIDGPTPYVEHPP